jgi:hypothetical protein
VSCRSDGTERKNFSVFTANHLRRIEDVGTEEKRETTFRSSTDEVLETLTWNYKIK